MKAILTVGVSASGKTTWAEQMVKDNEGWVNINRDDIRFSLIGVRDWSKWNWKREVEVTRIQQQMIFDATDSEKNIIISDTNLNTKFRNQLIEKLKKNGYDVELKDFNITFEEACKRDAARANGVGYSVIAKQMEQWHEYLEWKCEHEKHYHQEGLPSCIIVDIDGTLAHMNGRGAFEWHRVGEDTVDEAIKDIVIRAFCHMTVILLSGRDSVCRQETYEWLEKNNILFDKLYMREKGDFRKDTEVKKELFDKYIRNQYNVSYVIDDRPVVCRAWRAMGLKVLQVGNPYIEF